MQFSDLLLYDGQRIRWALLLFIYSTYKVIMMSLILAKDLDNKILGYLLLGWSSCQASEEFVILDQTIGFAPLFLIFFYLRINIEFTLWRMRRRRAFKTGFFQSLRAFKMLRRTHSLGFVRSLSSCCNFRQVFLV